MIMILYIMLIKLGAAIWSLFFSIEDAFKYQVRVCYWRTVLSLLGAPPMRYLAAIHVYILYEQQSVLCGAGKECRSYLSIGHDFYFFVPSIFSLYPKKMSDICSLCCCCCWSVKSARVLAHAQLLWYWCIAPYQYDEYRHHHSKPSIYCEGLSTIYFLHSRKDLTEHLWWYDLLHLVRVRV